MIVRYFCLKKIQCNFLLIVNVFIWLLIYLQSSIFLYDYFCRNYCWVFKIRKLLFIYLGLPVEGKPKRVLFWDHVLNRIKFRLFGWRSWNLSLGVRLILLKFVLSSLRVNALSVFQAHACIISSFDSILWRIFWVGCEDHMKTSWVVWDLVCKRKEEGGQEVKGV